jgi:hypothetical protein
MGFVYMKVVECLIIKRKTSTHLKRAGRRHCHFKQHPVRMSLAVGLAFCPKQHKDVAQLTEPAFILFFYLVVLSEYLAVCNIHGGQ